MERRHDQGHDERHHPDAEPDLDDPRHRDARPDAAPRGRGGAQVRGRGHGPPRLVGETSRVSQPRGNISPLPSAPWRRPPRHPAEPGGPQDTGALDRFFKISERGSTVSRELRGGLVTFFTMAYIVVLNPLIIGTQADSTGAFLGGGDIDEAKLHGRRRPPRSSPAS